MNRVIYPARDDAPQPNVLEPNLRITAFDFVTPDGHIVSFAAAQAALKNRTAVLIGGLLVGYGMKMHE